MLVGVLAAVAAALPAAGLAVVPNDGGPFTSFTAVTINAGLGDQLDAHVSGDIAAYTNGTQIDYYDFFSGAYGSVPFPAGATDLLSDVSNGKIAFSRVAASGQVLIVVYDIGTGTTTEIDPQPASIRFGAAIGADTVAFFDQTVTAEGELFASDLGAGGLTGQQVTDDSRIDQYPSVSPLGDVIVWESCAITGTNCDIHQAGPGASWPITDLTTNSEPEANPDTDGVVVVDDALRSGQEDIRWQPVGGGTEQVLTQDGEERNPSISAGVVLYESVAAGTAADLWVYEIAMNRRFQITNTPADETLSEITALGGGTFRIVWSSGPLADHDVYGATFTLPPPGPTYTFGGFLQPVDPLPTLNSMKAGAAAPVKFSLGGNFGLDIFKLGYPKSDAIACDSTALVDGIEETMTAGGSSLSYDAVSNAYKYVWKTEKAWAGTCRQLVLKFADGSTQRASFKFK